MNNLKKLNNDEFKAALEQLLYTGCEMEFKYPTKEHEAIALNMGLTTIMLKDIKTLIVKDEDEDINSWI